MLLKAISGSAAWACGSALPGLAEGKCRRVQKESETGIEGPVQQVLCRQEGEPTDPSMMGGVSAMHGMFLHKWAGPD